MTAPANPYPMLRGLGALGAPSVAAAAGTTAASYAASAAVSSGLTAEFATAGSVAGPIGTAVGAVVGLVASKLLNKQYLNVAQMDANQVAELSAFNQYKAVMGKAPGRQFGLSAMIAVWKGSEHAGFFHLAASQKQCFHEGCFTYGGRGDWIDTTINNADAPYQFPNVYQAWLAGRSAATRSTTVPRATVAPLARGAVMRGLGAYSRNVVNLDLGRMPRVHPAHGARRRQLLSGLGGFGTLGATAVAAPTPDAVTFIDHYFIPAAQHDPTPWEVPSNNTEHQILYDVADAYLATKPVTTTPYIAARPTVLPPAPAVVTAGSTIRQTSATTTVVASAPVVPPPLASTVTPLLPATAPEIAVSAGATTTVAAATQANLDAALAAQGFARAGTDSSGFPLYSQGGQIYSYQNGQLFPAGSTAQLATTGNAGSGISTPATGIDPTTVGMMQSMLAQGQTPAAAIAAAENSLQSQGVPITPDIYSQLQDIANGPAQPAGVSEGTLLLIGGGLVLFLMLRK